ncbi:30S ribosomal protein S2 [Candidatus Falkowbacteria bacterium]|nr:30S ribosomal protein S2 [Candidatus Falkowbacteria bacterium]
MIKLPKVEEMLAAGMHFGHTKSRWHPKMEKYIFAARKGVYIIDLEKSQEALKGALEFMENLVKEGKTILFVGTKNQVKAPMKELAQEAGMPYVTEKWLGGTLTNFTVFKKMIKKYKDLSEEKRSGKLDKYTKKERLDIDREMKKLELRVGGLVDLNKQPDALFIWDIKKEKTALTEARKRNIPVIALCDTNVDPSQVNYVIPGNDDATKTIKLVLSSVKETILSAKKEAGEKKDSAK